ncbi:very short patch repair endonuclease [Caballeronia sordidicola]|jgi:DNA mismatch endonuclease, patch repair protein|uniref:very short patch repair endonuclease n=1 Tax=Caballeronia sordidicola TaxID=196367 RepID=UPI00279583F3|nr:DNA mismatch endonuclease Vsr [Caballeronia sordidicola]
MGPMDTSTPLERSERMARIKAKHTKPERTVRSLVHRMGFRYRLHGKSLPGCPDLVFARRRKVIFVHGCFWHMHEGCRLARLPKSRLDFWQPKLGANAKRDKDVERRLAELDWRVMIVCPGDNFHFPITWRRTSIVPSTPALSPSVTRAKADLNSAISGCRARPAE